MFMGGRTKMSEISKSKQKRIAEAKAREAQRHKKAMAAMWSVLIPVLIVGFIVALVVIHKANQLDYSKYLNDDGTIASIDIDKYATVDYENMSFSRAELEPAETTIDSEVESAIEAHTTLSTDAGRIAEANDTVGISFFYVKVDVLQSDYLAALGIELLGHALQADDVFCHLVPF